METQETPVAETEPVTTIISRMVKPDRVQDFETWLSGINRIVRVFDGYLGMDVIRPGDHDHREYVIILRFNDYDGLKKWQGSQAQREWIEKSDVMTVGETILQEAHGLESWFTLPSRQATVHPPAKYKMAVLTAAAIYPLIMLIGTAITFLPIEPPAPIAILITVILASISMTYYLMPWTTRRFRSWLFGS